MAFRIADSVERGWLDASERGRVTGEIWLCGRDEPIRLNLKGFPMKDIAGRMLHFENPNPVWKENIEGLRTEQNGATGDMTASRKALHGDPPYKRETLKWVNALYLEWFSDFNGRVVIEAVDYQVTLHGEPAWILTDEEENRRQEMVVNGMTNFMERLSAAIERQREQNDAEDDGKPMDEFEWEQSMKESDERSDQFGELMEKYRDHPDRDRIVAREMGWDRLEDMLDADARGVYDEARAQMEKMEIPELEPNPETEGEDWIRTEDGEICHPVYHRAFEMSIRLHHDMKDRGFEKDDPIQAMIFSTHMIGAKLAGALNDLAYDRDMDIMAGMIVASLKRALTHFNEAVHRIDAITRERESLRHVLDPYRAELFEVREDMLRLMDKYRAMIR